MATQFTTNTALAYWQYRDRSWHVQYADVCQQVDGFGAIGPLAVRASDPGTTAHLPSTSLDVDVAAGSFRAIDGTIVSYGGVTGQTMSASATTRLWLDNSGTLTTGGSFPALTDIVRLASVTTDGSTVTAIVDERVPWQSFGDTYGYLPLSGGTMTGFIVLHADPSSAMQAATKQYVDSAIGAVGGAPTNAEYLTVSLNGTLTNERSIAAGTGVSFTDGGAGSTFTIDIGQAVDTTSDVQFASIQLTPGSAPGSPTDSQIWSDSTSNAIGAAIGGLNHRISGVLFASTADVTVANTTTSTTIIGTGVGTLSIPAGYLKAGKTIFVKGFMSVSSSGTPNLTMSLILGTATVTADLVTNNDSSATVPFEIQAIIRAGGASGSLVGIVYSTRKVSPTIAPQSFDNSGSLTLDVKVAWSSASVSNTVTVSGITVEILG